MRVRIALLLISYGHIGLARLVHREVVEEFDRQVAIRLAWIKAEIEYGVDRLLAGQPGPLFHT